MLVLIVESENAYLNLIYDLNRKGRHCPNQFANPDEHGMAISDHFDTLSSEIIEEYLGVRDYKYEVKTVVDENGVEWEEETCCVGGPLKRPKMHICPELAKHTNVPPPTKKDYPILIMWRWEDDFDRFQVKTRYFDWVSLDKIERVKSGKRTPVSKAHSLWQARYAEKYKAICRDIKERNRRKHGA